ncbi:MAG: mechanosensitive ion channel domain-containing protein [Bacteroidales bacterium]
MFKRISTTNFRVILLLLLFAVALGNHNLFGQKALGLTADTAKKAITTISLGDIPIKSVDLMAKTKQEIQDLISNEAIKQIEKESGLLLGSINPELLTSIDSGDFTKNLQFLENRKVELQLHLIQVEIQKKELAGTIHSLDTYKNKLLRELARWKATNDLLVKDSLTTVVPVKLGETIIFLDSTLKLISNKSNSIVVILDKTISIGTELEIQIEQTKALIKSKQENAFSRDHVPFFRMDFQTGLIAEIDKAVTKLIKVDMVGMWNYLMANINSLLISILLFAGLLYLFVRLKKNIQIRDSGFGHFYKLIFLKVLSHPFSTSLILTIFSTFLIFPNRPIFFRQFVGYLIAYPLLLVLSRLLDKKFHFYIYAFGAVIVFYMFLVILPSEFLIYRVILLFIAAVEVALLSIFLMSYNRENSLTAGQKQVVYGFVVLHLVLAFIGFVANISGRLILTEIVLSAVFFNIFDGLVLFITVLILDGLIATGIDTAKGQRINVFRMHGELVKRKTIRLLNKITMFLWVALILKNFQLLEYVSKGVASFFKAKISIGSASLSLDVFVVFFVVIYISIVLSQIIRIVLEEDVLNRFSLSKGLPHTIAMLVRYSMITAGFFLAVNAAGIPVDKLTIILGAMSVGIGFGLQNVFNNLVSGLILLFERPIQLGDTVQVGQLTGNVESIGLRSSNIKTFDGAEVIVPNGQLISNEVINWTLSDQKRRIEINVGTSYNSDPEKVHSLLQGILNSHSDILQDPAPAVFFHGLGESSLDFVLLFWIADYNHSRRIKSEILFSVFAVLKQNNIEIPFPQRDLHLRSEGVKIVLQKDAKTDV